VIDVRLEHSPYHLLCQRVEDEFQYHEKRRISCPPGVTGSIVRIAWYDNEARKVSLAEVDVYGSYGKIIYVFARMPLSPLLSTSQE